MNWTTWWVFVTTEFVLCLTPGPAVLYVLSSALGSGARKSLASNMGILAANTMYFVLSATGLGALLMASSNLFLAAKWMGAAYLIYLGLKSFFSKTSVVASNGASVETGAWRLFGNGFLLQSSNPNIIAFFGALLPQFINPHAPVAPQIAIMAVTSAVVEFLVLLGYGLAAGQASSLARESRYANWTNRIAGTLMIGAGAGLAALKHT